MVYEKIFLKLIADIKRVFQAYKEFSKLKKLSFFLKNFTKEDIQMEISP